MAPLFLKILDTKGQLFYIKPSNIELLVQNAGLCELHYKRGGEIEHITTLISAREIEQEMQHIQKKMDDDLNDLFKG